MPKYEYGDENVKCVRGLSITMRCGAMQHVSQCVTQESECSLLFLPIGSVPSALSLIGIACIPPGNSPVSSLSMCIHLPMTR